MRRPETKMEMEWNEAKVRAPDYGRTKEKLSSR